MIKNYRNKILVSLLVLLMGCTSIAPYNQRAYEQATSLKVDALNLMDKALQPYANHKHQIDILKINIEKAYEYAKGRNKNEFSTKQWAIIKDPTRNSFGGFLKKWEDNTTLDKIFIVEAKALVSDAFDTVIYLESGKIKK